MFLSRIFYNPYRNSEQKLTAEEFEKERKQNNKRNNDRLIKQLNHYQTVIELYLDHIEGVGKLMEKYYPLYELYNKLQFNKQGQKRKHGGQSHTITTPDVGDETLISTHKDKIKTEIEIILNTIQQDKNNKSFSIKF